MKYVLLLLICVATGSGATAQDESYRGGVADGFSADSLISFAQNTPPLLFAPYLGSIADGYSGDSIITFTQYASIPMFAPFLGSIADGYAGDSIISFAQHGYIPMYQPFSGGEADGWTGYPIFGVTIVPLNLLSFRGEKAPKGHELYWRTTQEQNSSHFEVERSADGRRFMALGSVAASGNSNTAHDYNYTDGTPVNGNNFYRLKLVDIDGSFKYSNIILLKVSGGNTLAIYPNPAAKTLNVQLSGTIDNSPLSATIFDVNGKYITGKSGTKSGAVFSIDVGRLAKGVYVLRVVCNEETSVWRFIKE